MLKASGRAWVFAFAIAAVGACAGPKGHEPPTIAPTGTLAAPSSNDASRPPALSPAHAATTREDSLRAADELHRSAIVVDTHDDVTQRLVLEDADISRPYPDAQTDIPRMKTGGLDAEFLSVWVPPELYPGDKAYDHSIAQFDAIDRLVSRGASKGAVVLARSAADVRRGVGANETVFLIGVEGGHSLGDGSDDQLIARLREFYARGARYMTLTWSNSNRLGGSSGDAGKTSGLTPFGIRVIRVMNELGMIVDISHVSDASFFDAVKASTKPVLASHSSARALCDHPRNMTDDMLKAVGDNGGAVCVNFGQEFLDSAWHERWSATQKSFGAEIGALMKDHAGDPRAMQLALWPKFKARAAQLPRVPASRVVDHIEHVARVAGIDHVCLGSDFDGIPLGPEGLDDVSKFPFITEELVRRGFGADDIRKVLGENVLRVLAANERKAAP